MLANVLKCHCAKEHEKSSVFKMLILSTAVPPGIVVMSTYTAPVVTTNSAARRLSVFSEIVAKQPTVVTTNMITLVRSVRNIMQAQKAHDKIFIGIFSCQNKLPTHILVYTKYCVTMDSFMISWLNLARKPLIYVKLLVFLKGVRLT